MKNNPIVGKDMTQHALQCFERGAATWWRMYQTINGWQGVTTWKEFKLTLPKSRLVSQKLERNSRNIKGRHERLRVNRDGLAEELEKDKHDRKKAIGDMNKT